MVTIKEVSQTFAMIIFYFDKYAMRHIFQNITHIEAVTQEENLVRESCTLSAKITWNAEFYNQFAEPLVSFLFKVFSVSIDKGFLPVSLTQGLITLIPKLKKTLFKSIIGAHLITQQ